ncbi:Terpenoid cyclases/protein prenyltransferase alpha-alpha toroid [Corchorus capsularis]|uniref:Terpenoid cyclases/protein prenyltransferase alpha-alpha toroid n=1 Tax=Corchorus capsularis TaxID=210143 RepID=A0A1R3HIB8_COCAP|nr:Terpenoid cyclases/protein prenyltransferase alpha-alpha toroid [Corchorus capsularis]
MSRSVIALEDMGHKANHMGRQAYHMGPQLESRHATSKHMDAGDMGAEANDLGAQAYHMGAKGESELRLRRMSNRWKANSESYNFHVWSKLRYGQYGDISSKVDVYALRGTAAWQLTLTCIISVPKDMKVQEETDVEMSFQNEMVMVLRFQELSYESFMGLGKLITLICMLKKEVEEIVAEKMEPQQLYDVVNVLLSLQVLNPTEFFANIVIAHEYVESTSSTIHALVLFKKYHGHRTREIEDFITDAVRYLEDVQRLDGSWYVSQFLRNMLE